MSNQKTILLLSHDDKMLLVSTLLRVLNTMGDPDGCVKKVLDEIQVNASPTEILSAAKEVGLEFGQCIQEFGEESESNAFAVVAQNNYCTGSDNNIVIDERVVISESESGAWVSAWLYVHNSEACLSCF